MNKYQKLGLVTGQIFVGLGFALAGGLVGLLVDYLRSLANGMMTDLFGSILTALTFSYIGLFVGISIDGYRFLKRIGRQNEFGKYFLQSVSGLVIGLLIFYFTVMSNMGTKLPHALVNSLAILLPLLGTILGFNFNLIQKEQGRDNV
ncbi:MAG: hypothetical protein JST14_11555 [Bacteroidetes bacterium]|nr:hypothetical protein [Bacteroidota bacterium]